MATKIPYSRSVLVTLSRTSAFPSRRGFGTPLYLTSVAKAGKVDATFRTKLYASMEEVAADWTTTDDFYLAALEAFSQDPRPTQIKVGYYAAGAPTNAATMLTQLDLIYNYDQDWYWITPEKILRDTVALDGFIPWVESHGKAGIIDSNDPLMENPTNTTNVAARYKGTVERTAIVYHPSATEYGAFALAATLGTYNFDEANSAYTAKFKRIEGVPAVNIGSSALTAVTGFTPGIGQSLSAGHMANVQIDIGGRLFLVEGSMLTPNVFIDEVHATDWIIARTEEEALGILLNNNRVPYTDQGMELLASAARAVMRQADRAGLIANDLDPTTGLYAPAVIFTIPSVFDVPASQRKARIAPEISVRFRYAGAVHYTTIRYQMVF